jgi:hypothetical protein
MRLRPNPPRRPLKPHHGAWWGCYVIRTIVLRMAIRIASHLLPVFGEGRISKTLLFTDTLNTFTRFYVNKYADHHAFEIAFWFSRLDRAWGAYIYTWYPYFPMLRRNYCVHLMNLCTYHVLHVFAAYLLAWPLQPLGVLTTCLAYCSLLLANSLSEK